MLYSPPLREGPRSGGECYCSPRSCRSPDRARGLTEGLQLMQRNANRHAKELAITGDRLSRPCIRYGGSKPPPYDGLRTSIRQIIGIFGLCGDRLRWTRVPWGAKFTLFSLPPPLIPPLKRGCFWTRGKPDIALPRGRVREAGGECYCSP